MPKASKDTAAQVDLGAVETRTAELGEYLVEFATFRADADGAPFFRGLPDDRCQSPHWGYVLRGRLTFRYPDRDEVYDAGDAYYAPPGHVPVVSAGTETVEFSPTEAYRRTLAVVAANAAAIQGA
ncbi:MAG TPA: hypothetical protein VHC45_05425 [Gaiellaceae bacterium]|nr:hypothetical protein [Gaiellaceae bacterium]